MSRRWWNKAAVSIWCHYKTFAYLDTRYIPSSAASAIVGKFGLGNDHFTTCLKCANFINVSVSGTTPEFNK
jgi:hypothetical protein